jgi:hypothetical protein
MTKEQIESLENELYAVELKERIEALENEFYALEYAEGVWTQEDLDRRAEIARILAEAGVTLG